MARIVMKFGGTSMAGIERIRHVADLVKRESGRGHQLAIVVSAMAGETDRLIQFCREASTLHDPREYDVVVASGEQVTSGLLAITLQGMGLNARSYMGWQLPIRASGHAAALIEGIDVERLEQVFRDGGIAVIPGFQGVTDEGSVATLGRGGSDTSAVALAAALKADRCDIYTDVDGVYTTDPRIVPRARKLAFVTYEEMLELASVGAKVLQTRSVALAMRHNLPIQVLSSFDDRPGTLIVGDDKLKAIVAGDEKLKALVVGAEKRKALVAGDEKRKALVAGDEKLKESPMERKLVTGIAYDKNEARITIDGLADRPGAAARIFGALARADINVDMIVQGAPRGGTSDITFTVPRAALAQAADLLEGMKAEIGFESLIGDANVVKVSAVGVGMRANAGAAATMFATLAERRINILAITTSEIKVTVLIAEEYTELAVRVLHTAFGLDAEADAEDGA
jgi:aspartate kinase